MLDGLDGWVMGLWRHGLSASVELPGHGLDASMNQFVLLGFMFLNLFYSIRAEATGI